MNKPNLIPVAGKTVAPNPDAERREMIADLRQYVDERVAVEVNAKTLTIQEGSERKGRLIGRHEGRWQGMIAGAALVVALMAVGYGVVTLNTAVAVRQGAAIAGAEAANDQIRQELDRR